MAQIPSYEQWMKDTKSTAHKRSEFLTRVDECLKPPQDKEAIRQALDRWRFEQSRQGKDWRENRRNNKGAVTNLYRAVSARDRRKLSAEEPEGIATENWSVKGKFQKVTGLPAHITEMMDQKIESWMGNPQTPPPEVDKSRIVGIGPNGYGY